MKNKDRFVALGALYDGDNPKFLSDSLKSISIQTLTIPIIIVINGPLKKSLKDVLREFDFLGIEFIYLKKNLGLAKALQAGIEYAKDKFDYVLRFDADDINTNVRFEVLIKFILKNNLDLASSHMYEIDENNNIFSKRIVPISYKNIYKMLPFRNPINHPASAFRIDSVISSGGYIDMPFFEDYYLWMRMAKKGYKIENIDEYLVKFRATDDMVNRRYGFQYMLKERDFYIRCLSERLHNPFLLTMAYISRIFAKIFGFKFYKKLFYLIRK